MKIGMRNRSLKGCFLLAGVVVRILVATPGTTSAESLRFPPLWDVRPLSGTNTWQWEGGCRGGLPTLQADARKHVEDQGWFFQRAIRLPGSSRAHLFVWQRDEKQLILLVREIGAARWTFSAGIRKTRSKTLDLGHRFEI